MSNKTEVQITTATKEETHNIGDYYKLGNSLYILANVQGMAVLIDLNEGCFFTKPVEYDPSSYEVNGIQFSKCCGSRYGDFVKVQKVKISIE